MREPRWKRRKPSAGRIAPGADAYVDWTFPKAAERAKLAAAIRRADHRCLECCVPLGGPVMDEGEWIPDSRHKPDCVVLAGGSNAMILEYHDILSALHAVGFGGDYNEAVPKFSESVA